MAEKGYNENLANRAVLFINSLKHTSYPLGN